MKTKKLITLVASVAAASFLLAACGSTAEQKPSADTPKRGGILKLAGAGDVDYLDPNAAYYQVSYGLLRAISRQLVTYPDSSDRNTSITPVADLATAIPTVSEDGLTYTATIRDGAQWDAPSGARQITSSDFVRGFKRICNPAAPFGGATYYTDTIVGFAEFCDGFSKVAADDAAAIKGYIEANNVAGITTPDEKTIIFSLKSLRSDFINILALPASSPAPVEVLEYIPDSPEYRQNFISSGPYKIAEYVADQKYRLVRNAAWKSDSDTVRKAYVDEIQIAMGSDEKPVFTELKAGTVDMTWDTGVPTEDLPGLITTKDKKLNLTDDGSTRYMVINLLSPNANKALANVKVRQALNYAVSKKNIIQIVGGPDLKQPLDQVLTPVFSGYEKFDLYPTPEHGGDPEKAKALLAEAGFPNGITLKYVYADAGKAPDVAQTLQADLAKAGITLTLVPTTPNLFYTAFLQNLKASKKGDWDLASAGWGPDWQGNAAVTFFSPLLDGRATRGCTVDTTNYNCYNSNAVNALIDKAIAAKTAAEAAVFWAQADKLVMEDAPWVPLYTGKFANYRSDRVRNWNYGIMSGNGDLTNVWLAS